MKPKALTRVIPENTLEKKGGREGERERARLPDFIDVLLDEAGRLEATFVQLRVAHVAQVAH